MPRSAILENVIDKRIEIVMTENKAFSERDAESAARLYTKASLREKPVYDAIKRVGDVVCSATALIVLSPLFICIMSFIFFTDYKNPIFRQERIGKDGKVFKIWKFRSMRFGAEKELSSLKSLNEDCGVNFKLHHDPRVTRIGEFIRKTSIDELPQLVNILKGDMSVIGPRPFVADEQAALPDERLLVKPGLSCYWQIGGKNDLPKEEQIALDHKYIKERSVITDVKIIVKTVLHVITGENY
ncbi:MAG: sugar transferase [Ruminococcus sp.]|nr:sugar transferase [Ruminococcus sp.]